MANKTIKATKAIFDLNTMDELSLVKTAEFAPVTTIEDAQKRVGNDTARFMAIINEGLESDATRALKNDETIPWMAVDDETGVVGPVPEDVVPANQKAVNGLVLNLAKTIFGFSKDMAKEAKRAAKEKAVEFIRANDAIKEGLKKNAAAEVEE